MKSRGDQKSSIIGLLALASLLAGCSQGQHDGMNPQDMQEIHALLTQQTTNTIVSFMKEPNQDLTVWTAPYLEGSNKVGRSFTFRHSWGKWKLVDQKKMAVTD